MVQATKDSCKMVNITDKVSTSIKMAMCKPVSGRWVSRMAKANSFTKTDRVSMVSLKMGIGLAPVP